MIKRRGFLGGAVGSVIFTSARADTLKAPVHVVAESPMKEVLPHIGDAFTSANGRWVRCSFGDSVAYMENLDPLVQADIFITADGSWMADAETRGLIQPRGSKKLVTNKLALIAPKDSTINIPIRPGFPLLQALGEGKLAMAASQAPASILGQAALEKLQVWNQVEPRVVHGASLTGALPLVAGGDAPLGIAYDTDAHDKRVRSVGLFPDDSHPPILYRGALTIRPQEGSIEFLNFLRGPEASAIFHRYGFHDA